MEEIMAQQYMMKGNEALAEAAIRAGCKHFFGYPITPQTEVAAYFAKRMPKIGGTFLQAESEIAAINMVLGAASAGARAMTSSSSPGISLKTEGISYIAGSDLPCLIVNVQRGGPGLGGEPTKCLRSARVCDRNLVAEFHVSGPRLRLLRQTIMQRKFARQRHPAACPAGRVKQAGNRELRDDLGQK